MSLRLEARSNRKYPFIDVAGEKLLLEAEEFTMARERLEDFRSGHRCHRLFWRQRL